MSAITLRTDLVTSGVSSDRPSGLIWLPAALAELRFSNEDAGISYWLILEMRHPKQITTYGAFPLRRGTGRVSVAKKWA